MKRNKTKRHVFEVIEHKQYSRMERLDAKRMKLMVLEAKWESKHEFILKRLLENELNGF